MRRPADLIRIGIIAAREYEVRPDTAILFVPRHDSYRLRGRAMHLADLDGVQLRKWNNEDFSVWLGYSARTNTLLVRLVEAEEILG